jgi:hypothetical protein
MAFTYDVSTDAGKVRLLIADTVADTALFADEEISAFIEQEDDGQGGTPTVKRAAALALEVIAVDAVRTLKVVQMLDLKTDGAAVARALRSQAAQLREQADSGMGIEIIQMLTSAEARKDYYLARLEAECA